MRFSEAWLREYANPDIPTDQLVEQLTMGGLEVDSVEPAAAAFEGVVIGEVLSVKPHPNADKLRICSVSTGSGDELKIVCGASNVYPGMRASTALLGAVLPDDVRIEKSDLRGEESFGMLCSEKELGLAEDSGGLMELPTDAPVGSTIRDFLKLDDTIIDIDLTPNRSDCLSIEGIAREVSVLNQLEFKPGSLTENRISHQQSLSVQVENANGCPRYLGRLIKDVDPNAITPIWLKEKLRRSGHRSLGPLIDVTNFVLLELGQPLHAFDAGKVSGEIVVRLARSGEKLVLLNGQEIDLDDDILVIADRDKPLAFAGVMGGQDSAVGADTRDIFLECAFFSPAAIRGKARRYGLQTDSSHRFERGVDPQIQRRAIERATELMVSIAGGQCGPITEVKQQDTLPERLPILLRSERIKRILGVEFKESEIEDILRRLGMQTERESLGWSVIPPSFRFDVTIEADLIEELGRVYGYDKLPRSDLRMHVTLGTDSEKVLKPSHLQDILVDRGYQEAITFSFVDEESSKKITPQETPIRLENPISSELSVMRSCLWMGLLLAAQHNCNRQQERIRLFESGMIFLQREREILQKKSIAGLATGSIFDEQWSEESRYVNFYDIKSDIEALAGETRKKFQYSASNHPALHPGQTAEILSARGERVGWLGMLHPTLQENFRFENPVFLFELDVGEITERAIPVFKQITKFPQVRRDIAVLVDKDIIIQDLVNCIYAIEAGILHQVLVFDVYRGKGVESNLKSVAIGLILQDYSETLTEPKIDAIVAQVLTRLHKEFGARLRD